MNKALLNSDREDLVSDGSSDSTEDVDSTGTTVTLSCTKAQVETDCISTDSEATISYFYGESSCSSMQTLKSSTSN